MAFNCILRGVSMQMKGKEYKHLTERLRNGF
jgi:hypothetical protein